MAVVLKLPERVAVDASFVLALILPDEALPEDYKVFVDAFKRHKIEFWSSQLIAFEILNGLKSAIRQKRISREVGRDLFNQFIDFGILSYEWGGYEEILELSIDCDLTAYDASYLFVSRKMKLQLLTLDKKLKGIKLP